MAEPRDIQVAVDHAPITSTSGGMEAAAGEWKGPGPPAATANEGAAPGHAESDSHELTISPVRQLRSPCPARDEPLTPRRAHPLRHPSPPRVRVLALVDDDSTGHHSSMSDDSDHAPPIDGAQGGPGALGGKGVEGEDDDEEDGVVMTEQDENTLVPTPRCGAYAGVATAMTAAEPGGAATSSLDLLPSNRSPITLRVPSDAAAASAGTRACSPELTASLPPPLTITATEAHFNPERGSNATAPPAKTELSQCPPPPLAVEGMSSGPPLGTPAAVITARADVATSTAAALPGQAASLRPPYEASKVDTIATPTPAPIATATAQPPARLLFVRARLLLADRVKGQLTQGPVQVGSAAAPLGVPPTLPRAQQSDGENTGNQGGGQGLLGAESSRGAAKTPDSAVELRSEIRVSSALTTMPPGMPPVTQPPPVPPSPLRAPCRRRVADEIEDDDEVEIVGSRAYHTGMAPPPPNAPPAMPLLPPTRRLLRRADIMGSSPQSPSVLPAQSDGGGSPANSGTKADSTAGTVPTRKRSGGTTEAGVHGTKRARRETGHAAKGHSLFFEDEAESVMMGLPATAMPKDGPLADACSPAWGCVRSGI